MSETEWINYYENNLAQSAADQERLSELQQMKEQLQEGEQIDVTLEKQIMDEIIKEIES